MLQSAFKGKHISHGHELWGGFGLCPQKEASSWFFGKSKRSTHILQIFRHLSRGYLPETYSSAVHSTTKHLHMQRTYPNQQHPMSSLLCFSSNQSFQLHLLCAIPDFLDLCTSPVCGSEQLILTTDCSLYPSCPISFSILFTLCILQRPCLLLEQEEDSFKT